MNGGKEYLRELFLFGKAPLAITHYDVY